jgi:neutral ceramidase
MYCEALKKLQADGANDPPFVAMMANGTSGDANNINFRTPRPGKAPYEQMRYVAEDVAAKVNGALAKVTWQSQRAFGGTVSRARCEMAHDP